MRSPNVSNTNNVRNVNTSGTLNNNNANNTNGLAPDCLYSEHGVSESGNECTETRNKHPVPKGRISYADAICFRASMATHGIGYTRRRE